MVFHLFAEQARGKQSAMTEPQPRNPRLFASLALSIAVAVAGCGNSSDTGSPTGGTGGTGASGGGAGGAGGTGARAGSGGSGGAGGQTPEASVVFVTEAVQNADLGGIDGANAICQAEADDADLAGTFVAWLSTTTSSVTDRLVQSTAPYLLVDGTRIADDWDDLVDGAIQARINLDANGELRGGDVWTGTLLNGDSYPMDDCAGFTSDSTGVALCGSTGTADLRWTENITPSCSTQLRVYCVEQ